MVQPVICIDDHFVMTLKAGSQERPYATGTHMAECHALDLRIFHGFNSHQFVNDRRRAVTLHPIASRPASVITNRTTPTVLPAAFMV
jgi:hypothetical protein